jgi:hypothetical protein
MATIVLKQFAFADTLADTVYATSADEDTTDYDGLLADAISAGILVEGQEPFEICQLINGEDVTWLVTF